MSLIITISSQLRTYAENTRVYFCLENNAYHSEKVKMAALYANQPLGHS